MSYLLIALCLSITAVPVITLERTSCFGFCPVYKLAIYKDGRVVFEGKEFVKQKGKAETRITKEAVQQLIRDFNRINYLQLKDEYVSEGKNCPEWWTDFPSAITSLNWQGKKKTVRHYHGCRGTPVLNELTALEEKIDRAVNTERWIK